MTTPDEDAEKVRLAVALWERLPHDDTSRRIVRDALGVDPVDDMAVLLANPAGLDERSRDDILAAYVLSQPPDPTKAGLDVETGPWPDCLRCRERHVREGHARLPEPVPPEEFR